MPISSMPATAAMSPASDGVDFDSFQAAPAVDLGDLNRLLASVDAAKHVLPRRQRAVLDPSDGKPADVVVVIEIVGLELRR